MDHHLARDITDEYPTLLHRLIPPRPTGEVRLRRLRSFFLSREIHLAYICLSSDGFSISRVIFWHVA